MSNVSLIVRADHFGLSHAANQAIWEGFETGVLTCASLAAAGPWVAEAAGLAREHPEWELGLELFLHCPTSGCRWGPVAGAAAVPSLAEPTGTFAPGLPAGADAGDVARELEAQVERARAWGIAPAYLHYEGVPHPAVDAALRELSERFGLPAHMTDWKVRPLSLPSGTDQPREAALLEALEGLDAGVHLWVVHPAHDAPETWALWPDEETAREGQADAVAVCSPEVHGLIERRGIELISFRQHLELRLGSEADE